MVETVLSVWYNDTCFSRFKLYIERFIFYDRQAKGISEEARELVKIGILQNYDGDLEELARTAAERTRSQLVQVIGRKFVLYKEGRDEKKKIILPPAGKKN